MEFRRSSTYLVFGKCLFINDKLAVNSLFISFLTDQVLLPQAFARVAINR